MQIPLARMDEVSLAASGREAVELLRSGNIAALADRFGYALAFDRDAATAIRDDLATCSLDAANFGIPDSDADVTVKYFEPNATGILALIECRFRTHRGTQALLELVVSGQGDERHVTLEQIGIAT